MAPGIEPAVARKSRRCNARRLFLHSGADIFYVPLNEILTEAAMLMRHGKQVRAAAVSSWPQRRGCLTDWVVLHTFGWLTMMLAQAEGDMMTPPAKFAAVTAAAMFGHQRSG
jgi:hypothetical protein